MVAEVNREACIPLLGNSVGVTVSTLSLNFICIYCISNTALASNEGIVWTCVCVNLTDNVAYLPGCLPGAAAPGTIIRIFKHLP